MAFRQQPATGVSPETFPLAVLMVYREPGDAPWDTGRWDVAGVVAGDARADAEGRPIPLHDKSAERQLLWPGLRLTLFKDEAAGYYHNLMASEPSVFVLCRPDDEDRLEPWLATLSYDDAAAYMEVEEEVFSVPMPPEIYRWSEAFVLEHYVPEKRRKRKRDDWKKGGPGERDQRKR